MRTLWLLAASQSALELDSRAGSAGAWTMVSVLAVHAAMAILVALLGARIPEAREEV